MKVLGQISTFMNVDSMKLNESKTLNEYYYIPGFQVGVNDKFIEIIMENKPSYFKSKRCLAG